MLRRIIIYFLTLSLTGLGFAFIFIPPYIVKITKAQITEGLRENLPYEVDSGVLVTVQSAMVELSDENRIILEAQFDARGLTLEGMGTANVTSSIIYENGKFYLSELKHDNIFFTFSENSKSTISDVKSTLEGILRRETEEADASGDKDRVRRLTGINEYYEAALQKDAVNLLDDILSSFPVYDLKRINDSRFRIAALSLDDVEINSDGILVTLSFQRLITTLACIIGTVLFFAVVIFGPWNTIRLSVFLARFAKSRSDDFER